MLRTGSLMLVMIVTLVGGEAERLPLWTGQAPIGDDQSEPAPADATITLHRPAQPNGAALVICPGGGYGGRVSGPEGHGIAAWLNAHGITGVVLDYRLPRGRAAVPLLDAQRAIRLTRANAGTWAVDPARIGIIGFSAGGHLAASAATLAEPGVATATDEVERLSSRPDFAILVYPVISLQDGLAHSGSRTNLMGAMPSADLVQRFSLDRQVDARTPSVYLAHALDDRVVVIEHSRIFAAAMVAARRPVQVLELPSGGHGLDRYQGPNWEAWQAGSLTWMSGLGLIPARSASME